MTAVSTSTENEARSAKRSAQQRSESRVAWLFMLPAAVLLLLFIVVPFVFALVFSFTNQRLISPLPTKFVGLDNYVDIFTDGLFWKSLWNNFRFVVFVVPVQTAFALLLAVLVAAITAGILGRVVGCVFGSWSIALVAVLGGLASGRAHGGIAGIVVAVSLVIISKRALRGDPRDTFLRGIAHRLTQRWGTSFVDADLTGADFTGTNASRADLSGATLEGVSWDPGQGSLVDAPDVITPGMAAHHQKKSR